MRRSVAAGIVLLALAAPGAYAQSAGTPAAPTFIVQQPVDEWLASLFRGEPIKNVAGEIIGDVNDLLFDKAGQIQAVVIGVGGFLGVGEKEVAVPFKSLSFSSDKDGHRLITLAITKDALERAPTFQATEKSLLTQASDKAKEWGKRASDKAGEIKDQASKKIEEMTKEGAKPKPN